MFVRPRQNLTALLHDSPHDERRRHGRIRCQGLTTQLGPILDLSASGCRVHCKCWCKPKLDDLLSLEIRHAQGLVPVKAKIVWVKRLSLRQYDVAFEFTQITDQTERELSQIAQSALHDMSIAQDRADLL